MSAQRTRNKQIRNVDNQMRNINDQMLNINNTPTSTITTITSSSNTPTVQGAEMQVATQLKSQMSALVSLTSALHITRSGPDSGLRGGRIGRGGGGGGGGRGAEAQPAQDITMPMSQLSALISMISAMNITRPSSDFGPSDSDLGGGSGLGEGGQGEQGGGNVISPSYVAAVKSISSGIDTVAAMILAAIDLNLTLQRRLHPQPQQPQQPQSQLHYRSASGSGAGVISIEIDTGMDFNIEDSKDEHELIKTMTKTMGEYGKFLKMTANDLRVTAAALTEAANNYRNHHINDNGDYSDNDYNHKHTVSLLLKQFLEESGSFERMFVEYTEIMRPRMATWN
ncbi:MAG: hypothetical protein J3R72DRAFT_524646 [Linnemannia gamsii]|nr:MAG: hypothetical protein J3R72DRAFT_524646 [Linnemannia gamsii]